MIAITFALPEESEDLRRAMSETKEVGRGKAGPVLQGRLHSASLVICHTGIGAAAAIRETRNLIRKFQPSLVVSSGFAGALANHLEIGDVIFDARETGYPGLDGLMPRCFAGALHTSRRALETAEEKSALHRKTGALAVDMETGHIAAICGETGVPILAIRGISDASSDPLPVPMARWFDIDRQRPRPFSLVSYLMRHPSRIGPFARFVRGLSGARLAMTHGILLFLARLAQASAGTGVECADGKRQ